MPKIFLSSVQHVSSQIINEFDPYYTLESFYVLQKDIPSTQRLMKWFLKSKMFILDSGAFTFMNSSKVKIDFNEYVNMYIDFINRYDIKYFFEMDVDKILGYDEVKVLRKRIESETNKRVIPVWHKSRGIEDFVEMCSEYKTVSIGGIASREIKKSEMPLIERLCKIAHENGCVIHGLGFLRLKYLNENNCPFDWVDGSSWQGHIRGYTFSIDNGEIKKIPIKENWKVVIKQCFKVWTEFSKEKDSEQNMN